MQVLRLTGIVGCSLSIYCQNIYSDKEKKVGCAIGEVYKALKYAHTMRIVHMDVHPNNIIVRCKENQLHVLLADWGCSMFSTDSIGKGKFVGCTPYAHDQLLGNRDEQLTPIDDFDYASLGYTWFHAIQGGIAWQFGWPNLVTVEQLHARQCKMKNFVEGMDVATARCAPRVRDMFAPADSKPGNGTGSGGKKRPRRGKKH